MKSLQWQEFAKYINGSFTKHHFWHSAKVDTIYKNHRIIFDNYTVYNTVSSSTVTQTYTRVITPLSFKQEFYFEIYRKSIFSSIAKLFGMQDIETGHHEFDKDFIIKSNNGFKVKQLLNSPEVRKSIESIQNIHLSISDNEGIWGDKLPEGQAELSFYCEKEIHDFEKLKEIQILFHTILDQFQNMEIINN